MASTPFASCWIALAQSLDDYGAYPVSSATVSTVVSSLLLDSTADASENRYNRRKLYILSGTAATASGTVKDGGFVPSTGALTLTRTWSVTPVVGDVLVMTAYFPVTASTSGEEVDYGTIARRALRYLIYEDTISLTTVANAREYALPVWLDRPERLLGVLDPPREAGQHTEPSWRQWHLQMRAGTPYLQFKDRGYRRAGDTFKVLALRPAHTLVNGAESVVGPSAAADTVIAPVDDVVTVGRWLACEALAARQDTHPGLDWIKERATALGECRKLRYWDRTNEVQAAPVADGVAA